MNLWHKEMAIKTLKNKWCVNVHKYAECSGDLELDIQSMD